MNTNVLFRDGYNGPWIRSILRAWGTEGETMGDYRYCRPIGVIECVSTGRVYSVPLERHYTHQSQKMSSRIDWHGAEASEHVRERAVQFVTLAALTVARRGKDLLSIAGTAASIRKGHKGERVEGAVRSKLAGLGGNGRVSCADDVANEVSEEDLAARVGTNLSSANTSSSAPSAAFCPAPGSAEHSPNHKRTSKR